MRRIVEGKTYNTDTATTLGFITHTETRQIAGPREPGAPPQFADVEIGHTTLYQALDGAFFLVRTLSGDATQGVIHSFRPLPTSEAVVWAGQHRSKEIARAIADAAPQEGADAATMLLRLPLSLKSHAEAAAAQAGQSVSAWVMRAIERSLPAGAAGGGRPKLAAITTGAEVIKLEPKKPRGSA